jgi:hypothetical protein
MSSNNRNRQSVGSVGMAVGAAFAAALIASGPVARADAPGPFEDLFGDTGINTWTPAADASLLSSDPALAGSLDTSVENFLAGLLGSPDFPDGDAPFSDLVSEFDPTAFTGYFGFGIDGGFPDNTIGDFAVGLDYTLFATGIAGNEVGIWDLLTTIESVPAEIAGWTFLLELIFGGALGG